MLAFFLVMGLPFYGFFVSLSICCTTMSHGMSMLTPMLFDVLMLTFRDPCDPNLML